MHHIQKKIIESLTLAPSCRYSEMRPKKVESNQFAYHLKQLMKNNYVEKRGELYFLTPEGMAYVDRLSHATFDMRQQPKIVSLLDITTPTGETALLRRLHQPYYGKLLFPTGKIHLRETMLAAAERECEEKLGLKGIELTHRGEVMVGITQGDVLISQTHAHVFHGETEKLPLKVSHRRSECFWGKPETIDQEEFLPGFFEIKTLLGGEGFFCEELWFDI